ncbi:MAG: short-chain dehydrogenase [Planctomycetota bacterium]|nr:MAG: short-chain dehydrogenase [Planctomycetota bacterium]
MPVLLLTGANRGLGLEFVRQYLEEGGWRIHACCRRPEAAAELAALAQQAGPERLLVHGLDVADFGRIEALAEALRGEPIDLLLNNAGVLRDRDFGGFGTTDYEAFADSFRINAMAPLKMAEAFVEHVARSERRLIVNITSRMGSIADNTSGGFYTYRASKAALNMVTRSMALDLAPRGITCVVLHPGWVRTDMGGQGAPLAPRESIAGMRRVIAALGPEQSGRFFAYDGSEIPW